MLIGELAELTGASARSLRHYESVGLLDATRSENGYRRYSEESIERVRTIQFLLGSGLTTSVISEILPAMLYKHCKLEDPGVRAALEGALRDIHTQLDQLTQSKLILSEALNKGELRRYMRRPST